MSGNHNQSLDRALQIIEEAAKCGVDAIKIQTYTADTMTLKVNKDDFMINDPKSLWNGRHLYDLYEEAHTPWEWHSAMFAKAKELGVTLFSTPFDETAVDFLETLDAPVYKIASFENTDVRLIKKVAQTGKPVIISTGMSGLDDLQLMVKTLRENGCNDFVLLKCTSAYPASPADANLATIPHLAKMFGCQVGLSDHTMGIGVPIAAVALGATVIEKHFCLSRAEGGVDSAFSLEPAELRALVEETEKAWLALGTIQYHATDIEEKSKQFRRSIYFVKPLSAGDVINEDCIRAIRPGFGLPVKEWTNIIGKKVKIDVEIGDRVTNNLLG
ncbi:MAG: pseudaminic acid synthase [Neisseriaceae bacterium]|nr:MAG: pseudaminic acid synthase [Neisseriaceae bacterium]